MLISAGSSYVIRIAAPMHQTAEELRPIVPGNRFPGYTLNSSPRIFALNHGNEKIFAGNFHISSEDSRKQP
jgi:hypothetical protein